MADMNQDITQHTTTLSSPPELQGLTFGEGDFIELDPAPKLELCNHDFTAEAWLNVTDFDGHFDKTVLGTNDRYVNKGLHLALRDAKPFFGFYNNYLAGKTYLKPGVWYHVAWRYTKASQEMALFVNGTLDAQETGHAPFIGEQMVLVGCWSEGRYFHGRIAELRLWNTARTVTDIQANMGRKLTGTEANLKVYRAFDQDPGAQTFWLEIELLDEDGQPAAGETYRVTQTQSSNLMRLGQLDDRGQARVERLSAGPVKIAFPNLDQNDWDIAEPATGQ